jgi:hypothetical protein
MRIPARITAGDTAVWTDTSVIRAGDGQPITASAGWSLAYSFRGPTQGLDITGTASGAGWSFALSAAQSAALNAGPAPVAWYWQARATNSGTQQSVTLGSGQLQVLPNLSGLNASRTFDGRSQAEITLSAIEAEITARLTKGASVEYTIGNRSLKKEPLTALLELRTRYQIIVRNERSAQALANGLGNPTRVGVRFV